MPPPARSPARARSTSSGDVGHRRTSAGQVAGDVHDQGVALAAAAAQAGGADAAAAAAQLEGQVQDDARPGHARPGGRGRSRRRSR